MTEVVPSTTIPIAPKPISLSTPNSKLLSPLQIDSINTNTHSAEKVLIDVTTKGKPVKILPKLTPPQTAVPSTNGTATTHTQHPSSSPPKLDQHPPVTLTPLNVPSSHPTLPTTTPTVPSHNSSSPSLVPLSSKSSLSPEKLDKDAPARGGTDTTSGVKTINKKKPRSRRISSLEPLPSPSSSSSSSSSLSNSESVPVTSSVANVSAPVAYNPAEHNGTVTLLYEQYKETFSIKDGTITEASINDTYGLSEVMPNCRLRISTISPAEMREATINAADKSQTPAGNTSSVVSYLPEQPQGTHCHLQNNLSYYIYVKEDKEQLDKEQAERDIRNEAKMRNRNNKDEHEISRDDGRGFDSCTCIYGTPCVDEYGCRDWSKRFDIASANGWGGFSASSE